MPLLNSSQASLNTLNSVSVVKISWHNVNLNTSPIYVKVKKMNDPL